MLTARRRTDVLYELAGVEQRIATRNRSLHNTVNHTTVAIEEAGLRSLDRRREELAQELRELPEEGATVGGKQWAGTPPDPWPRSVHLIMETGMSIDMPDLPNFLKR
jgi:hypothetical protein